jgi:hypothetical protein
LKICKAFREYFMRLISTSLLFFAILFINTGICQTNTPDDTAIVKSLTIISDPPNAEVYINDSFYGRTPATIFNLKKTGFTLSLVDSVNDSWITSFGGNMPEKVSVYALINKEYGLLNVVSTPSGAQVYINDTLAGTTPLKECKTSHGLKKVCVKKDGYQDWTTSYYLNKMNSRIINCEAVLHSNYSVLSMNEAAKTMDMVLDGQVVVKSAMDSIPVLAGEHKISTFLKDGKTKLDVDFVANPEMHYKARYIENKFFYPPTLYSAILPGFGQFSQNAKAEGVVIFGVTVGLGIAAKILADDYSRKLDNYRATRSEYLNASNELDALGYKKIMLSAKDDADKAQKRKNVTLGLFIAAYAYNLLDVIIFHSIKECLEIKQLEFGVTQDNTFSTWRAYGTYTINF